MVFFTYQQCPSLSPYKELRMARGRHPVRLRISRPDPEIEMKYLTRFDNRELYQSPQHFTKLNSSTLFGNENPLHIDAGCGTGDFLCEHAQQHPDINHVGIDTWTKGLLKGIHEAADRGLSNIHFIKADIRNIVPIFEDACTDMFYILFPAPVLKKKHKKHEILSNELLSRLPRILSPAARVLVCTDSTDYYEIMKETVNRSATALEMTQLAHYPDMMDTFHYRKWHAQGRHIHCFLLEHAE